MPRKQGWDKALSRHDHPRGTMAVDYTLHKDRGGVVDHDVELGKGVSVGVGSCLCSTHTPSSTCRKEMAGVGRGRVSKYRSGEGQ
jgi:hypothetical protein